MSRLTYGFLLAILTMMFVITNYDPAARMVESGNSELITIDSGDNYIFLSQIGFECPRASYNSNMIRYEIYTTDYNNLESRVQEIFYRLQTDQNMQIFLLSDKNTEVVIAIYENGKKVWHL